MVLSILDGGCLLDYSLCFSAVLQCSQKWLSVDFSKHKIESRSATISLFGNRASQVMRVHLGRYCYKGTFTQHTFLGQEAKEFYSLLMRIQKKKGLETRKSNFSAIEWGERGEG